MSAWSPCVPYGAAFRLALGLGLSLLLLVGCAGKGDLGRLNPDVEAKLPKDFEPAITGKAASAYALTDDERQLRALAANLLNAVYLRERPHKVDKHWKRDGEPILAPIKPEAYADRIVHGPFRSATARYSRLIDDARNDISELDQFFAVARRVADMDRRRERSLAHVSGLAPEELTDARRRIRENMMLMAEVHGVLRERAAMYRFTLERLVIALPSPMAVEAERIRGELEARLAAVVVIARPGGIAATVVSK
jgi:hypothetical protein